MATIEELLTNNEEKMKKTISFLREDLAGLRAGRATPALLNKITVDYYGTPTPINQVANIGVPEPRMIVITPWEKTMIKHVHPEAGNHDQSHIQGNYDIGPGAESQH